MMVHSNVLGTTQFVIEISVFQIPINPVLQTVYTWDMYYYVGIVRELLLTTVRLYPYPGKGLTNTHGMFRTLYIYPLTLTLGKNFTEMATPVDNTYRVL